ncbi:conserved membrane hypothetical protein [Methylocella tundrae]|uniref:SxtJ n=1 Tax=Methylocella tundrae TaxID=227605 RepID=A0A8B6MCM8_METTU|nr:SxtJ family membrane protein [Methylocella tundrae]VTZ52375.1 conserved membrane hypothetical protein [Methylocella tundrae]
MQTHENVSSFRKVVLGSNQKFGLTFGFVLALLGVWPMIHHHSPRWILLAIGAIFAAFALFMPDRLSPLNRAWFKFGMLLNRVVNPLIMGLMFFAAVTPLGWVMRKTGSDLLNLKIRPDAKSYWIEREPSPEAENAMTKQF